MKVDRTYRYVPDDWTVLIHGTNLGRNEWCGRDKALDQLTLTVRTNYPGLSCVTAEDRIRQFEESGRMGSSYDATSGFSTVPEGKNNRPVEIEVVFPNFHKRKKGSREVEKRYEQEYGVGPTQELVRLANQTHYELNQQHPVIPNGTELEKVGDELQDGKRVVRYVPRALVEIFIRESRKG